MYNRDNTKEAEAILERITKILAQNGGTQNDLISYLSLPRGTFSSWKAGRSRNYCEHLGAIAAFLDVDVEWLVTGKIKDKGPISATEKEMLMKFRELNESQQLAMLQIMDLLKQK